MRKDLVFQNFASITPGQLWQPALADALQEAEVVIVFWCRHASKSFHVREEYTTAIKEGKSVLSLKLDDANLPEELAQYPVKSSVSTFQIRR